MTETIIQNDVVTAPEFGMDIHVSSVPIRLVAQTWPDAEPFIKSGLDMGQVDFEDYTIDQAKAMVLQGYWHLVVGYDDTGKIHGAAAVEMINRANDRVAFVVSIAGRMIASESSFDQLASVLKAFGATAIEGAARESIARLWKRFGFKTKYAVVGMRI